MKGADFMKKKISLLTLTAFCIGDTIGCGIFATLPEGVSRIGSGVIYAWLAAIFLTVSGYGIIGTVT